MNELSEAQHQCWREIQQSGAELDSPFFAPDFSALVAEQLPNLEVAILSQGIETIGFLPFQRNAFNHAEPPGMLVNDFQGILCADNCPLEVSQLLEACNLRSYRFNHLIASHLSAGYPYE